MLLLLLKPLLLIVGSGDKPLLDNRLNNRMLLNCHWNNLLLHYGNNLLLDHGDHWGLDSVVGQVS